MSAFPRSSMSNSQLETISWFCRAIGCETTLPSVKQVYDHRDAILACAGAATEVVEGSLDNIYCVNDLGKILQHEWANPCVRPHIDDYPVEYGPNDVFDRQAQGQRWCMEVHGNLSAPMYRGPGDQDFFVDEPALVDSHDGPPYVAMVTRWFKRDGLVWGRGHAMECDSSGKEYIIDGALCLEFKGSDLLLNYVSLEKLHPKHRLPSPNQIRGVKCGGALDHDIMPWTEPLPNPWRTKANGKRVFTPPIELYCDDTSGNQSKRWNKHNSFLFTLAGLDPKYAHLMYHIHFLATSNIAPPLEMLERILMSALRDLRENGVEAYNYVHREVVLLAPWILNKLGDNPMQSELSSHIGTRRKCHCRICNLHRDCPAGRSEQQRIYDSLSVGSPRNIEETRETLKRQLDCFLRGAPTSAGSIATATGVKDQYFDHFSTKLGQACSEEKEKAHRLRQAGDEEGADKVTANLAALMRELRDDMPADLFKPGLRIPGLDPNADTPVEVLHTVLLGFVKYFWRDAISLLDDGKKKKLIARLDSLDVFDLGLPPLRGQTLVQYAGSLTGHDFRVIAQVAPAVLFDLVDNNRYEAWLALCRLTPLALRPELKSLEAYLIRLEHSIDDFLACTALWSKSWFNKPKFHLILHLPRHIRRFGPAILFATESFESYNAVIRLRSVHSNRHAPSHDIAMQFSHLHAVRHLLSGGIYFDKDDMNMVCPLRAGKNVRRLLDDPYLVHLMGMDKLFTGEAKAVIDLLGSFMRIPKIDRINWSCTLACAYGLQRPLDTIAHPAAPLSWCQWVTLSNGDIARLQSIVVLKSEAQPGFQFGRIEEILANEETRRVAGVLLRPWVLGEELQPYRFPSLTPDCTRRPVWVYIDVSANNISCGRQIKTLIISKSIDAAVHAFHNCSQYACAPSRSRRKVQERLQRSEHSDEYLHDAAPTDLVLNLAQLRSAAVLDPFRPHTRYPGLSREEVAERAAEADDTTVRAPLQTAGKKRQRKTKAVTNQEQARSSISQRPAHSKRGAGNPRTSVDLLAQGQPASQAPFTGHHESMGPPPAKRFRAAETTASARPASYPSMQAQPEHSGSAPAMMYAHSQRLSSREHHKNSGGILGNERSVVLSFPFSCSMN
ncbi:uncharacterized protein SCHCODRAFT_02482378 [Schizophyllum commune H4-8]|uniref:uncharacterized protein n=1 Tax=Schizophyllum commune (strain H4-8 / FGSC 9210) TaxID=578458 RepID=UPI0021605227|nr:uncharacterized protein SCHCODRAFT_02482378 [Schizophyllum commune H4-8]KAI5899310.1 hypothetical protein SCHCODRAFT_02482378 [Schizophyllum commune H4-8]